MASLTLIRGVPGSGKSTLANLIRDGIGAATIVEADQYFMRDGVYQYDHSEIAQAQEWCQGRTRNLLELDANVIVANTFVRKWTMQPYFDMARELNIPVQVIICQGSFDNEHGVPKGKVIEMRKRFEY